MAESDSGWVEIDAHNTHESCLARRLQRALG
jgi:hypothetical protein